MQVGGLLFYQDERKYSDEHLCQSAHPPGPLGRQEDHDAGRLLVFLGPTYGDAD